LNVLTMTKLGRDVGGYNHPFGVKWVIGTDPSYLDDESDREA